MQQYFIYILASKKNGTLYVGMTSNLVKRIFEHKNNIIQKDFTTRYKIHNLVYFEQINSVNDAILREKQLKNWKRSWKINLIQRVNPNWYDLYKEIV